MRESLLSHQEHRLISRTERVKRPTYQLPLLLDLQIPMRVDRPVAMRDTVRHRLKELMTAPPHPGIVSNYIRRNAIEPGPNPRVVGFSLDQADESLLRDIRRQIGVTR